MFKALRHRVIARLWAGQALSSIGDEIYRVGLTWLAVGLIGADAGYLNAGQAASLMILSFVGGKWADHWAPLSTMIWTDLARAVLVLVPVVVSYFMPVPLAVLWIVALSVAGLSAFFDPALQGCLPRYSPDRETLRSANGLMGTTIRMARMIGPSIVGLLAGLIPMIHFFTLDALTFLCSAANIRSVRKMELSSTGIKHEAPLRRASFAEAIASGFRSLQTQKGMGYVMFAKAITSGAWALVIGVGLALLVHDMSKGDARVFGMVIASYGVGNFLGALFFGNQHRERSFLIMFTGHIWLGLCFVSIGISPSIPWVMLSAAVGGFGGPMNDLAFIDLVQKRFPVHEVSRIFRLRLATETAAMLLFMLLSPTMIRLFRVQPVIMFCGVVWIAAGSYGLWRFRRQLDSVE